MKILKNRIFLSAVCIIVAAVISFGLLPRFYEDKSATIMVLRVSEDIPVGTEIKDNHLTTVEVGNYGLPEGVINDKDKVLGKIAQTKIIKGDYFFPQKLGGFLVNELSSVSTFLISLAVAVTICNPLSLISSSRLSICLRCVDLFISVFGKKNWSTDTSKRVTSS